MTANAIDFDFPTVGSAKPKARETTATSQTNVVAREDAVAAEDDGGPRALPEPSIAAPAQEVRVSQTGPYEQEFCEVTQNALRRHQMPTGADVVKDAATKAEKILSAEHRGAGDTLDAAMHRAEARWGIPHSTFWSLRYRRDQIADIKGSILRRLDGAIQYLIEQEKAKLRRSLEATREVLGDAADHHPAVGAAEALVGEGDASVVSGAATPLTEAAT